MTLQTGLTRADIESALTAAGDDTRWNVEVFDQLPSTNDYLRHRPAVRADGNVIELCATDWQTAGHGRRGKQWSSQPGNVTFTLRQTLQRPASELLGLSLVTGIAVATVLKHGLGVPAQIKWPNDIMVDERKLGGLLIELMPAARGSGAEVSKCAGTDVLTGIGINVYHQPEFSQLGIGATSLERLGIVRSDTAAFARNDDQNSAQIADRSELIARIASTVASLYQEFDAQGWAAFESRWPTFDALYGRTVTVSGGTELTGEAAGVNGQGALLVKSDTNYLPVLAGEVSVRPI